MPDLNKLQIQNTLLENNRQNNDCVHLSSKVPNRKMKERAFFSISVPKRSCSYNILRFHTKRY